MCGAGVVLLLLLLVAAAAVRATVRRSVRQFRTAMNRQKGARLKGTDSIEEI